MKSADDTVLLIAPFMKKSIIEILLKNLKNEATLMVYTRWRLDEILSGVSDIEIWELIRDKQNATLKLCPNLHAKYYRFDDKIVLGSANLTARALMKNSGANLELLQSSKRNDESHSFEMALSGNSITVNNELFEQVKRIVGQQEGIELPSAVNEIGISYDEDDLSNEVEIDLNKWLPKSRNPENLYAYYSGDFDSLTTEQTIHAKKDLCHFPVQDGLKKHEFNQTISLFLLQMPVVQKIDGFLSKDRRFGEMADFLEIEYNFRAKGIDSKRKWQTLMRWLLKFLNDKYYYEVSNFSEIFSKK